MAYCYRCGNQVKEGALFCDRCGGPLSGGSQQPYGQPTSFASIYTEGKDPLLAAILSILLPGAGQIYVGRVLRGSLILLLMSLFSVIPAMLMFAMVSMGSIGGSMITGAVLMTVAIAIYVWQMIDACRLAEEHDRQGSPLRH